MPSRAKAIFRRPTFEARADLDAFARRVALVAGLVLAALQLAGLLGPLPDGPHEIR